MFDGFSEPKAGVNRDARARNAGGFKRLDPFTQKTRHFSHHILIRGRALHRLRRAQHMHHAYPAVAGAHRVKRAGLAKSLDIVDQIGAFFDHALRAHARSLKRWITRPFEKRIRREVENAHHQRARERETEASALKIHGVFRAFFSEIAQGTNAKTV